MKLIVLVKQVLDPAGITVRRDKERIFFNREDYIIEPGSLAALEAALRIKDTQSAKVVALSLGPPRSEDALREALALGCDAAYLINNTAIKEVDVTVAVHLLAAAIKKIGHPDLILAGVMAADTGSGQIGSRLAEELNYPQVTGVSSLTLEEGLLHTTRTWQEDVANLSLVLPAVVTVAPGAFPARYPHGAQIMNAYREMAVTIWNTTDLELEEGSLAPRLSYRGESFPPPLPRGEVLRGSPDTLAEELVSTLRQYRLIG